MRERVTQNRSVTYMDEILHDKVLYVLNVLRIFVSSSFLDSRTMNYEMTLKITGSVRQTQLGLALIWRTNFSKQITWECKQIGEAGKLLEWKPHSYLQNSSPINGAKLTLHGLCDHWNDNCLQQKSLRSCPHNIQWLFVQTIPNILLPPS